MSTPIAYATAQLAALFIRHFPRDLAGVIGPSTLPAAVRRAILAEARAHDFRIQLKVTRLKRDEEDEF